MNTPEPLTAEEFLAATFDQSWMTRPVEECRAMLDALLLATLDRERAEHAAYRDTLAAKVEALDGSVPWDRVHRAAVLALIQQDDALGSTPAAALRALTGLLAAASPSPETE